MQNVMVDFQFEGRMMRYSRFVPRFYNLCKSYGFEQGRIMPSRAFCSDENQGFPIILITKHFGAFPLFSSPSISGLSPSTTDLWEESWLPIAMRHTLTMARIW